MAIQEIQENDLIKDSREVINDNFTELDEGKLSLSGGTMTGLIYSNTNSNIDATSSTRLEESVTRAIDKNGSILGTDFYSAANTGVFHGIRTTNPNINGGANWADIRQHIDANGKHYISIQRHSSITDGTTDNSDNVPTTAFIHNNYLSLAGGTMTGQLVINKSNGSTSGIKLTGIAQNYAISALNTNVTKGTAPSATQYWAVDFYGKDDASYNQRIGMLETSLNANNVATTSIRAYNCTTNTNTGNCAITVNVDGSGNAYTSAPTPATTDDSTKIATTAWVRDVAALAGHTHSYLPLSGGTMTGTITRNGYLAKNSADNGYVEVLGGTDETSSYICIYGKNHSSNPGTVNIRAQDGTNSNYLQLKPNGSLTWGGLDITPQTFSYSGTSSDVSVPNNTVKNLFSFTLSKGTWLVIVNAGFANHSTGYRTLGIATSTTSQNMDRNTIVRAGAANGTNTNLSLPCILAVSSSSSTFYVNVLQTSGSSLNVSGGSMRFRLSAKV